jgi:hypothetical protein
VKKNSKTHVGGKKQIRFVTMVAGASPRRSQAASMDSEPR